MPLEFAQAQRCGNRPNLAESASSPRWKLWAVGNRGGRLGADRCSEDVDEKRRSRGCRSVGGPDADWPGSARLARHLPHQFPRQKSTLKHRFAGRPEP